MLDFSKNHVMSIEIYVAIDEWEKEWMRGTDEEIGENSRRWKQEKDTSGEEERTIPCAHDGTKMQSPGINEETRSCWSKFSRRGWEWVCVVAVMKLCRDEKEGLSRRSPLKPPYPPAWSVVTHLSFRRFSHCSFTRSILALNARLWYSSCVLPS